MSIENIGTSPAAAGVTRQVDTITISSASPAALSKTGIVSYPAFEQAGASPTADVIKVHDVTTATDLVLTTDYTLTASGAGPTLTYSVTRVSSSSASADGNTCTVTYNYGTIPDTTAVIPPAGTAPAGTADRASVQDTAGTATAGIGAAMPGGSTTDPAMGTQSSSETGAPGSEYTVTPVAPGQYGWAAGTPDTEGVYGGATLPENYTTTLGNAAYTSGNIGIAADPAVIDTTIGGGAVHVDGTPPVYRAPVAGIAASSKDTTLTDILGNQISANPGTDTGQYASVVDTQYFGAPARPTALASQADTFPSTSTATKYYLSKQGLTPSTIVVTDTTTSTVLTLTTDYTVTTVGNGALTASYIQPVAGTHYTTGDSLSVAYTYGDPAYWDSNVPAAPPSAPTIAATTSQTDTITLDHLTPAALSLTGVVTPPGSLVVTDLTSPRAGNVLVLNTDYTVTVSGSGSTLAYSITRLNGSVKSSDADTAHVTYSVGNAAYFTSGPVRPVNRGVLVPWTPPAATTPQVDYYFVQSSTLGTQWVPATGQAMFTGQPSGAGAMVGEPTYQSDTFTTSFSHTVPVTLTKTGITTAKEQIIVRDTTSSAMTIPTSGYITGGQPDSLQAMGSVLIYGVDYTVTQSGVGPYASYQVTRVAGSVNSADGDTIVVEYFYNTNGTSNLTAVADAVTWSSGSVALAHSGIVTPPAGLAVYDSTISKALAYGLDYTVTQAGTGATTAYTITRVPGGPATTGAGDSLTVYYSYGVVLGSVFTQGMYENMPVIYKPDGTVYGFQGYRFAVAAGNRAGLSAYSAWSDYAVPLNYNAPQPGFQGTTTTITGLDPVNTINPVYRPDGTVRAGTGLGG